MQSKEECSAAEDAGCLTEAGRSVGEGEGGLPGGRV